MYAHASLSSGSVLSSSASFISSTASSSLLYTTTSSSTIPGPGALAGKAILALGKAALHGMEALMIRKKLSTIRSHFPHTNTSDILNIEEVYADLLELSRSDIYPTRVRQQALQLLFGQIIHGHTQHLIRALVKWPLVEIKLFLSDIMRLMSLVWTGREPFIHERSLLNAYRSSISIWECHTAVPFFKFLSDFAQVNDSTLNTVLNSGFLDMLAEFREPDFLFLEDSLRSKCNASLLSFSSTPAGLRLIIDHPLHILWPKDPLIYFFRPSKERFKAWRMMGKEVVDRRIFSISMFFRKFTQEADNYSNEYMFDAFIDVLEFSGCDTFDSEITSRAIACLFLCIKNTSSLFGQAIITYLQQSDYLYFVTMMSRLIYRLLPLTKDHSERPSINAFIYFCLVTVQSDYSGAFRRAILDAGLLRLLRPLLEEEIRDLTLFPTAFQVEEHPISVSAVDPDSDTWKLSESIRDHGVAAYFKLGQNHFVLQDALHVLLPPSDSSPDSENPFSYIVF